MCYWEYTQKQNWIMVVSVKTIIIMSNQRSASNNQLVPTLYILYQEIIINNIGGSECVWHKRYIYRHSVV